MIKPVYGTRTLLSITLDSLADGAEVLSTEVDNSVNRYLDLEVELDVVGAAGNFGFINIFLLSGTTTGEIDDSSNGVFIGSLAVNANIASQKTMRIVQLPQFYKIKAVNASSNTTALAASGNTINIAGINYEDV